ncbi:MAG: UDP-2,3-diacylglucosamine diphosphatase [Caulobacteraceae bacterium]|nr:UDP-2,3-diacylglucosamine diphosphatase [Caulobacteraceae bacterium]
MNEVLAISDIHLGDKDCQANQLLKVLKKEKAKTILIVGDLFDHHNLNRLNKTHWKVLSKLRKLSKRSKIIYLIGNHCFLKAEFMSILLGFDCRDEYEFEIKDKKFIAVHGDIFDIYFSKYKSITEFIVNFYYFIRHYTPFADNFFKLLRKKTESLGEKTSNIKGNAIKYCEFNNKDSIICGHSHKPEHEYGKFEYINTGSFCEEKVSYVVIDKKGKVNLIYLD